MYFFNHVAKCTKIHKHTPPWDDTVCTKHTTCRFTHPDFYFLVQLWCLPSFCMGLQPVTSCSITATHAYTHHQHHHRRTLCVLVQQPNPLTSPNTRQLSQFIHVNFTSHFVFCHNSLQLIICLINYICAVGWKDTICISLNMLHAEWNHSGEADVFTASLLSQPLDFISINLAQLCVGGGRGSYLCTGEARWVPRTGAAPCLSADSWLVRNLSAESGAALRTVHPRAADLHLR